MTKIRVVEIRSHEWDTEDFDQGYYEINKAHSDAQKMELDRKDVESGKAKLEEFDDDPQIVRTWTIIK